MANLFEIAKLFPCRYKDSFALVESIRGNVCRVKDGQLPLWQNDIVKIELIDDEPWIDQVLFTKYPEKTPLQTDSLEHLSVLGHLLLEMGCDVRLENGFRLVVAHNGSFDPKQLAEATRKNRDPYASFSTPCWLLMVPDVFDDIDHLWTMGCNDANSMIYDRSGFLEGEDDQESDEEWADEPVDFQDEIESDTDEDNVDDSDEPSSDVHTADGNGVEKDD